MLRKVENKQIKQDDPLSRMKNKTHLSLRVLDSDV